MASWSRPWPRRRVYEPKTDTEIVEALVGADRALRQRDRAIRQGMAVNVEANIQGLAMPPNWTPEMRQAAESTRAAIINLIEMEANKP